jgi:hypothetical protein
MVLKKNIVNIDETIMKAAKEGAREVILEINKSQRDRRFHNTWLLMKNYNKLKDHIDKVKADVEFDIEVVEDKIWLTSIARTKIRTMQMIAYLDSAMSLVEKKMRKECIEYKYKAFKLYFIDDKTNEEISNMLGCGKNQPKLWSDAVLREISILLWGIEALGI